jgi:hypothetical protein
MVFGFVCLFAPLLLLQPEAGLAFDRVMPEFMHAPLPRMACILVCASTAVALSGVFARAGWSAMMTFLATEVVLVFGGYLLLTVGTRVLAPTGHPRFHIVMILAVGAMAVHGWFLYLWSRPMRTRPIWTTLAGVVALIFLPALATGAALVVNRVSMAPKIAASLNEEVYTFPSPDGHTVALSVGRFRDGKKEARRTYLLDVDTNKMRTLAPWWQESWLPAYWHDPTDWSPDGSRLICYTNSIFTPPPREASKRLQGVQESVLELAEGRPQALRTGTPPRETRTRWLGDGTMAVRTPDAWEFTDIDTGVVKRCANPILDTAVRRRHSQSHISHCWSQSHVFGLDREIASIYVDGVPTCHYWHSAPGLARTEYQGIPLPRGVQWDYWDTVPSQDGKWVLAATRARKIESFLNGQATARSLCLASVSDGTAIRLADIEEAMLGEPLFTPDSSLLIIPTARGIRVWNVNDKQWEPEVPLPRMRLCVGDVVSHETCSIALSPCRPWRLAMAVEKSRYVYVIDLETQTSSEAFSCLKGRKGLMDHQEVTWLGGDRLLVELKYPYQLWLVQADGSDSRRLLP